MKSFRIVRIEWGNAGRTTSFAGYIPAVDLAHALFRAVEQWGPGHYTGIDIPGPIPVTYSHSGQWYSGLRF